AGEIDQLGIIALVSQGLADSRLHTFRTAPSQKTHCAYQRLVLGAGHSHLWVAGNDLLVLVDELVLRPLFGGPALVEQSRQGCCQGVARHRISVARLGKRGRRWWI